VSHDLTLERWEEQDGRTRMTIVHTGFPTADLRDEHWGGWPGFLDRLERAVN
jgi:Activator of Hsp90 ATPase homolog 1-like protein